MNREWKRRLFIIGVAVVSVVGWIIAFSIPVPQKKDEPAEPAVYEKYEFSAEQYDVSTREGFICELIDIYEVMTETEIDIEKQRGKVNSDKDNIVKAVTVGLIDNSDPALFSDKELLTSQTVADLCYRTAALADESFKLSNAEAEHILNYEFNNAVLDDDMRIPYAFLIKHNIVGKNWEKSPVLYLSEDEAQAVISNMRVVFGSEVRFKVGNKSVRMGESSGAVAAKLGTPNRIDKTEYGFDWYVYNEDYSKFMMVGMDAGVAVAFFSNSESLVHNNLTVGMKYSDITDYNENIYTFIEDETTGTLDAILYNPYRAAELDDQILKNKGMEFFDMLNSVRHKKQLSEFIYDEQLSETAADASRHLSKVGIETADNTLVAGFDAANLFRGYENLISLRFTDVWDFSTKRVSYGGCGVYTSENGCTITLLLEQRDKVEAINPTYADLSDPVYPQIKSGSAAVYSPTGGQVYPAGENVTIKFSDAGVQKYHVEILNCESRDYAVNAVITGDIEEYTVPSGRFSPGVDYELTVTGEYAGTEVLNYFAEFSYGDAAPIEILSPTVEHEITDDNPNVSVIWKSDVYTDFQIDLIDEKSQVIASSRVIDKNETELSGLAVGKYSVKVSALRRNSNIIKAAAENGFEVLAVPQVQIIKGTGKAKSVGKNTVTRTGTASFAANRYSSIFGGGVSVYNSKEEADRNMTTISIPVWKMNDDGTKSPSTQSLTVNTALADEVTAIFTEIYNSPEKFPIKSVGGYNWRNTATGGTSQHSYGTCIDINPTENYCIYRTGKRIGSYWKPYEDPYSMPSDGIVVKTFKAHGWTWGGEWNSLQDYMHFSYLGG